MKFLLRILTLVCLIVLVSNPVHAARNNVEKANRFAQAAHESFEDKNFPKAGDYYEKAYKTNPVDVYKENAINAYLHHAFDELNEKNYNEVLTYCHKALNLEPGNKDAREILSDAYYSRGSGYYYRGSLNKARLDLEKALSFSMISEQRKKAEEMLAKIPEPESYSHENRDNSWNRGFSRKTSSESPTNIEVIELMELKIYGQVFNNLSMEERVGMLEREIFKRNNYRNSLVTRIDNLKKVVLPETLRKAG